MLLQFGELVVPAGTEVHLTLQEATAFLQTQARQTQRYKEGSYRWAREVQSLALLCTAIATGRRRTGLLSLQVPWVDFQRNELRYERDKGKPGRVLPVAPWAMSILKTHIERARPILDWHPDNGFLFVGRDTPRLGKTTLDQVVEEAYRLTVQENPDLTELAAKRISPHSFRVSFSTSLRLSPTSPCAPYRGAHGSGRQPAAVPVAFCLLSLRGVSPGVYAARWTGDRHADWSLRPSKCAHHGRCSPWPSHAPHPREAPA